MLEMQFQLCGRVNSVLTSVERYIRFLVGLGMQSTWFRRSYVVYILYLYRTWLAFMNIAASNKLLHASTPWSNVDRRPPQSSAFRSDLEALLDPTSDVV